jgi:hypothetical protein
MLRLGLEIHTFKKKMAGHMMQPAMMTSRAKSIKVETTQMTPVWAQTPMTKQASKPNSFLQMSDIVHEIKVKLMSISYTEHSDIHKAAHRVRLHRTRLPQHVQCACVLCALITKCEITPMMPTATMHSCVSSTSSRNKVAGVGVKARCVGCGWCGWW